MRHWLQIWGSLSRTEVGHQWELALNGESVPTFVLWEFEGQPWEQTVLDVCEIEFGMGIGIGLFVIFREETFIKGKVMSQGVDLPLLGSLVLNHLRAVSVVLFLELSTFFVIGPLMLDLCWINVSFISLTGIRKNVIAGEPPTVRVLVLV
ncbi:hypothetical protein WICPIJ_000750 [Wickerhamomyces pijperi]|uniref:Uncharacterized protein n=1 Tax=Wickerhamomyces pijperi TaxID=599730 RepID=A0A9P8TRM1_WICPI|nr:hypothetical protein WICPIJ_000750 [Wickerhamomyces pijperi]